MTEPVSVSRRVDAPAAKVFAILADPARHPGIDGSGMVRQYIGQDVIREAGDTFTMRMHNDEMGDYEITNHVVDFEQDRRIRWEPVLSRAGRPEDEAEVGDRAGHQWGYRLTPDGDGTVVTEIYDCSAAPEWLRKAIKGGERWRPAMSRTLENLSAQV